MQIYITKKLNAVNVIVALVSQFDGRLISLFLQTESVLWGLKLESVVYLHLDWVLDFYES